MTNKKKRDGNFRNMSKICSNFSVSVPNIRDEDILEKCSLYESTFGVKTQFPDLFLRALTPYVGALVPDHESLAFLGNALLRFMTTLHIFKQDEWHAIYSKFHNSIPSRPNIKRRSISNESFNYYQCQFTCLAPNFILESELLDIIEFWDRNRPLLH
eukprot:TRINITY_DN669_c0_g1_i14.p2 TRINITY_DN669_c0_g1~~TRINITY_DN669_c0_g1_i14.p2  ORF type:complete len:157 (+),score=17.70 TRINITY_DN669_c0_g1_i14:1111-1581(+)